MTAHSNRGFLAALFCCTVPIVVFGNTSSSGPTVLNVKPQASESLIYYKSATAESYSTWTRSLDTFMNDYRQPNLIADRIQNIVVCSEEYPPPPGRVCDVDIRSLGPCISENHYGYHRASPCVFLTLKVPLGWEADVYDDVGSLPAEMPSDLKSHIGNIANGDRRQLNTVWVSCEGVYPADMEFIGSVQYFPRRGFAAYSLLNNNASGYLSPVLALHFERPSMGVLINVRCKAWARNIDNTNDSSSHGGEFSLLID